MSQELARRRRSVKVGSRVGAALGAAAGAILRLLLENSPIADALRQRGWGVFWTCGHSASFVVVVVYCGVPFYLVAVCTALLGYYLGRWVTVQWNKRRTPTGS